MGVFAPAFLAANGKGTDSTAQERFHLAQKGVVAQGAAGSRVKAQGLDCACRLRCRLEGRLPLLHRHPLEPLVERQQARRIPGGPAMRTGAGPGIVPGVKRYPRANRIQLDVGRRMARVRLVQRTRVEPALPEMPQAPVQPVDILRIHQMGSAQRFGERILGLRRRHQVNVVRHQALGRNREAVPRGAVLEIKQVDATVVRDPKHILPVVPALGHMMRHTRYHKSRLSSHDQE